MQIKKIKAVIFDADGVIFNSQDENGKYLWSRTIKKDIGLTSEHFSAIFSEKWDYIIRGKIDINKHLETIFQEELFKDIAITPQQYIQYWLSHDHQVNQDILNLVKSLKTQCYLGTNQDAVRTSHIMNTIGPCFKGCFASYDIGFIKPEREFFQYIENTLLLTPQELLLIDDMENNIAGAQACGWNSYHYQNDIEELKAFLRSDEVMNV